jgi:hypothetical protein
MHREEIDRLARIVWDYHLMKMPLSRSEVMLVLGSNDLRAASYSARLYREGWAPLVVFSGGLETSLEASGIGPKRIASPRQPSGKESPERPFESKIVPPTRATIFSFPGHYWRKREFTRKACCWCNTPYSERRTMPPSRISGPSPDWQSAPRPCPSMNTLEEHSTGTG